MCPSQTAGSNWCVLRPPQEKRVGRSRRVGRRRRVGKIRRRTTIGMVGMTKRRRRRRSGKYIEFNGRCHGG